MAREKVDNKLNVVIGTKAEVKADTTIPDNSIVIVTDDELTPSEIGAVEEALNDGKTYARKNKTWVEVESDGGYEPDGVTIVLNNNDELEVSDNLETKWENILNKPTLSTVATSGSYNDLTDKPDLSTKVDKNNAITGATKTKITYDSKGLVTGGSDLVETDIPALAISKITGLQTALDDLNTAIGNIDSILDSILGV